VSKTVELRKVISSKLKTISDRVSFEVADNEADFPYIVYDLSSVGFGNYPRNDVILTINVWDKTTDTNTIETLADNIESILDHVNNPTTTILPTFYLDSRQNIQDEDKEIKRRQLRFTIQNYERS